MWHINYVKEVVCVAEFVCPQNKITHFINSNAGQHILRATQILYVLYVRYYVTVILIFNAMHSQI